MTLDKARELLTIQVSLGSGYNRNSAKLILAEVHRELPLKVLDIYWRLTF